MNYRARFTLSEYIKMSLLILLLIDLNQNSYRDINCVYAVKGLPGRIVRLIALRINQSIMNLIHRHILVKYIKITHLLLYNQLLLIYIKIYYKFRIHFIKFITSIILSDFLD